MEITGHAHTYQCTQILVSTLSVGFNPQGGYQWRRYNTASPGDDRSQKGQISSLINCKQWPENSSQKNHKIRKAVQSRRRKTSLQLRKPKFKRSQRGAWAHGNPSSPPGLLSHWWNEARFHHLASRTLTISTWILQLLITLDMMGKL